MADAPHAALFYSAQQPHLTTHTFQCPALPAALLSMSNALTEMGVVRLASDTAAAYLQTLHLSWPSLFMLLHLMFYGCHYLFASQTAHVGALYPTALGLMVASGEAQLLRHMRLT